MPEEEKPAENAENMETEEKSIEETEEDKKQKQKKSFRYSVFVLILVVFILALILFGIKVFTPKSLEDIKKEIIQQGSTDDGYMYNGYVFINQDGLWHTELQSADTLYNLHFHYSPAEVDQVPVIGTLGNDTDRSKFYITFDPNESNISLISVASSELGLNLVRGMNIRIIPACSKNETEGCKNRPIITCDNTNDSVILVRTRDNTAVVLKDNCIILQGKGDELLKAVDRMLFDFYGITTPKPLNGTF